MKNPLGCSLLQKALQFFIISLDGNIQMRYTPPDLRKNDSFQLVAAADAMDDPEEVVATLKILPKIYIFSRKRQFAERLYCSVKVAQWFRVLAAIAILSAKIDDQWGFSPVTRFLLSPIEPSRQRSALFAPINQLEAIRGNRRKW